MVYQHKNFGHLLSTHIANSDDDKFNSQGEGLQQQEHLKN